MALAIEINTGRRRILECSFSPPLEVGSFGMRTARRRGKRQAINDFIRSGAFDGVIDFDAVTRDPSKPKFLRKEYDKGASPQ